MKVSFARLVLIGLLACAMFPGGGLAADEATKPKTDPPKLSARMVGEWTSEPFETSMGKATQTFCFRADGTVTVRSELAAGPVSNTGTYVLEANVMTIKLEKPVSAVVLRVSFSGERLVLTDESAQARSYGRGSNGC